MKTHRSLALLWLLIATALSILLFGCASTTVYRNGKPVLHTQANAARLEFRQGDTSLVVDGLDQAGPTRAGGSVVGTAGTAVAGVAAAVLTRGLK